MTLKPRRRHAPPKWRSILCPITEGHQHNHERHQQQQQDPLEHHHHLFQMSSFLWLAERRQFSQIADTIRDKRYHHGTDAVTDWLHASSCTPLHDCLPYHPPTPLFIQLLTNYASVHHHDAYGRSVLHIACYHNCHISIVVHLLRYLSPRTPDRHWQRLPLHWNCASTQRTTNGGRNSRNVVDANLVAIATVLKQRYPGAIHVRDGAGMVPNDLLVVRRQQRSMKPKAPLVVAPDTMVVLPPAPLRETVSDLTNEGNLGTTTTTTNDADDAEEEDVVYDGRADTPTTSNRTFRHAWRRAATLS